MPVFANIYALSDQRNLVAVSSFLDAFAPARVESAGEYEIPQYSSAPTAVFANAEQLIAHCCNNANEAHAVYWRVLSGSGAKHAMVFFLTDGHVVFGLSVDAQNEPLVKDLTARLLTHTDSVEGLVTCEEPPPSTAMEFRQALSGRA